MNPADTKPGMRVFRYEDGQRVFGTVAGAPDPSNWVPVLLDGKKLPELRWMEKWREYVDQGQIAAATFDAFAIKPFLTNL